MPYFTQLIHKDIGITQLANPVFILCIIGLFVLTVTLSVEIGLRRINGASPQSIFALLSWDIIKWIVIAGVIAIPIAYYVAQNWLINYINHVSVGWAIFMLPVLIQCLIAILTTSGVSLHVLSQNPVAALKTE